MKSNTPLILFLMALTILNVAAMLDEQLRPIALGSGVGWYLVQICVESSK